MKQRIFRAVFNILDANTGLVLEEYKVKVTSSVEGRARRLAERKAMSYTHDKTLGIIQKRYSLTARQLRQMMDDQFISPKANYFVVELNDFYELNPRVKCSDIIMVGCLSV